MSETERTLLLQILGEPLDEEEQERLADTLKDALPEGYSGVLMHRNPQVEAMTKEEVAELVEELKQAAGIEEVRHG